jgi:hypothetical protein
MTQNATLGSGSVRVEDLLATASAYATQAIDTLILQAEEDPRRLRGLFYEYLELVSRLEIHFLFPNLDDYDRGLLVALARTRAAIMVALRNSGVQRTPEQQREHERALLELKASYVHARGDLTSRDVRSRMTPSQQWILDQELLAIPFKDPASTRLPPGAAPGS